MNKKKTGWTLFLDRDGVINHRLPGDYVKSWSEFKFLPHVLTALKKLKPFFDHTFIVTNQQGVGKKYMTLKDLEHIHSKCRKHIRKHGGHIDHFYACLQLKDSEPSCRKPNVYMGLEAKKQYPDITFDKAVMIGDSSSDIEFGKNLGMITVLIDGKNEPLPSKPDYHCAHLMEFYRIFTSEILAKSKK